MRLLADEDVPERILGRLEAGGHDVERVRRGNRGADDRSVLALGNATRRLILTRDRGFGELVIRERRLSAGVVIPRFLRTETVAMAASMLGLLADEGEQLHDALTIMRVGSGRRVPLPPSA